MHVKNRFALVLVVLLLLGGCSKAVTTSLTVNRPSKVEVDARITKIFIDPAKFNATKDSLKLKNQVLKALAQRLNAEGRYKAVVGPVRGVDLNREVVGILQGQISSFQEIETGQTNRIVNCYTGRGDSKDTRSRRGLNCGPNSRPSFAVTLLSRGAPQRDQAVQVVPYQNIAMFLQADFSLTKLGKQREMIVLSSKSAKMGTQILYKPRHAYDTGLNRFIVNKAVLAGYNPMIHKEWAIATKTHPGKHRWNFRLPKDPLSKTERDQYRDNLVYDTIFPFVQIISPYKVKISVELIKGGGQVGLLKAGQWEQAQKALLSKELEEAPDFYHLGLTYEALAKKPGDYVQAKHYYLKAMVADPENRLYSLAVGRVLQRVNDLKTVQTRGQQ